MPAKPKLWMNERELASYVVGWFKVQGFRVFQEVRNIDMVVQSPSWRMAVECKLVATWVVFAQAWSRRAWVDGVSVAIPAGAFGRRHAERAYAFAAATALGVGIIEVLHPKESNSKPVVRQVLPPRFVAPRHDISKWLLDRTENYVQAGSPGGASWTPFKETIAKVRALIATTGPLPVREVVARVQHHYVSAASARQALAKVIGKGEIAGLRLDFDRAVNRHVIAATIESPSPRATTAGATRSSHA